MGLGLCSQKCERENWIYYVLYYTADVRYTGSHSSKAGRNGSRDCRVSLKSFDSMLLCFPILTCCL